MINFSHGKHTWKLKTKWDEVTLEEFIALMKLEMPEKLNRLYEAGIRLASYDFLNEKEKKEADKKWESVNELSDKDLMKDFPVYYGNAIRTMSDIPDKMLEKMSWEGRTQIFDTFIRPFVISGLFAEPIEMTNDGIQRYIPPTKTAILMNDEIYYYPESLKILDEVLPMAGESVLSFTEAVSIEMMFKEMTVDGIGSMPLLMAIYCRKEDEEYDDKVAMERQELFKKATMDDVWSLFFYIDVLTGKSMKSLELFSRVLEKRIMEQISASED